MTATHPTDRELGDFLLGKLGGPDDGGVESHLAECDSCRDRAVAVQADDTFTELLASARTRLDRERASAPTPTLDGAATPPAFAPTLAWDDSAPGADATGLAPPALAAHPKYRPLRRLGTGGMGTVWLAEHQVMHRPVAVKVIRPDLLARPGATDRFLREVRAAARLHHPNIVTAFDADPAGDSCLLVMEYVPGQTLGERLEAGPLPVAEALRAVRDAARGLAHAHAHGLVHRDIKPHNLIRTASPDASAPGVVKVLDFGLAGVAANEGIAAGGAGLTGAGMVVGTPDYIAPEQIADPHAADARADIYGLGCTLYHLLAGRPPMPDGSVMEKLSAQRTRPMDPIPGLPAALATVLAKMTAKDPKNRYQSADEVVAALEKCIRMVDLGDRCHRWRRNVAAGLLVTGLLVTAGVVFKIYRDNQEITVTTNDDNIEVVMKRKGEVLRVIDRKTGQEWTIDTDKNEIAQAETPEGLRLTIPEKEDIVLTRHGKAVFLVRREATAASPPAKSPPAPRLVQTIEDGYRFPQAIAYTPDGKALLSASRGSFAVYDPATGKSLLTDNLGHAAFGMPLAVSADGRTAATASGNLFVYDLAARKRATTFPRQEDDGKITPVTALSLTPDGQTLAAVVGREVVYYDRATGQVEHTRPDDDNVRLLSVRYTPDGRYLVVVSHVEPDEKTRISVLSAKTRQPVARHVMLGLWRAVHLSGDGTRLFVSGEADGKRGLVVLSVPGCDEIERDAELPPGMPVPSPDGTLLALIGNDGDVRVWDRRKKQVVFAWTPHPDAQPEFAPKGLKAPPMRTHVAFAPDGRTLATARGDQIRVWELTPDPKTGGKDSDSIVHNLPWPDGPGGDAKTFWPAFSPDGRYVLASAAGDRPITAVWEAETGKPVAVIPAGQHAVFLPDSRHVLATGPDSRLVLWDVVANKEVRRFEKHPASANTLSVSADGTRAVSGDESKAFVLWDVATGRPLAEFESLHNGRFTVSIAPDGKHIATVGLKDRQAILWEVENKRVIWAWKGNCDLYGPITWLPDGRRTFLTAVDQDEGAIIRFDQRTDRPERLRRSPAGTRWSLSPDGHLGLAHDDRGPVRVTKVMASRDLGQVTLPTRVAGSMAVSPDGRLGVATAPAAITGGPARVYVFRLPGPGTDSPTGPSDPKLQGTWNSASLTATHTYVTFAGDRFTLRRSDTRSTEPAKVEVEGTLRLEPTTDAPRRFQVTDDTGTVRLLGIYRVEADAMFLCVRKTTKADDYPTKFVTDPPTGTELLVLKRGPVAGPDRDRILGTWRGVAAEVDGQAVPKEFIEMAKPTLTFTPDKVVGKPRGTIPKAFLEMAASKGMLPKEVAAIIENGAEGLYHLDPTKAPKEIDFTILGDLKRTGLGIYQLDGDTLKLCLSIDPAKVSERPKEFATKAGEMRVVLTLRRMTPEEVILEDVERRIDPANTDGKSLPFALLEHNGVAAIRFGKWRIVFEGVLCDAGGKILFGVGSFHLPETGGRGNFVDPGLRRPAPALRQQSTGRGNMIGIERYEFKMEAKGARLVFADHTYEATDQVQTIVIAADGTTRVEKTK
jgi:uncharacterized protein (TIGR03067 family)